MCGVLPVHPEEVVVVRGLGVQVSSTSWAGLSSSVFLPHTVVGDLVINEGITMVSTCLTHQPQKRLLYLSLIPSLFSPTPHPSVGVVFYLAVTVVQRKAGTDTPPQILKLYPLFTVSHTLLTPSKQPLSPLLPLSSPFNQCLFPLLLQLTFSPHQEFHPRLSTIQECYHLLRDSLYEPSASPRKPSP